MYLGVDLGTSSIKAVLLVDDYVIEKKVSIVSRDFEQDPNLIGASLREAIIQVTSQVPVKKLRGISLSGHGPSVLFVNPQGEPLTSILTWQDSRAVEEANSISENFPGFTKGATSYEAKVFWFYNNHPHLFSKNNKVLYPKDYFIYKLSGQMAIDESAASTIDFYDRNKKQWVFDKIGIPNEVFPSVVSSWKQVEVTGTEFSRSCNLPDGIPIYAGGIDAYCETIGAGAISYGQMVEGTGTSTCVSVCCQEDPALNLHVIPNSSINIRPLSFTGGSVKWLNSLSKDWQENYQAQLDLNRLVKVLFLPYLIGERSPIWDEKATGAFIGLTKETGKMELYQAVLQGVAFAIKQNIELLQEDNSTIVRAVGGGAGNLAWLQMKADITGKIYEKPELIDSAALGSALIAGFGRGDYSLEDLVSKWVKVDKVFYPNKRLFTSYQKLYHLYERAYPDLKNIYHQLADLGI